MRRRATVSDTSDARERLINPKDAKVVKEFVPVTVSATTADVR